MSSSPGSSAGTDHLCAVAGFTVLDLVAFKLNPDSVCLLIKGQVHL